MTDFEAMKAAEAAAEDVYDRVADAQEAQLLGACFPSLSSTLAGQLLLLQNDCIAHRRPCLLVRWQVFVQTLLCHVPAQLVFAVESQLAHAQRCCSAQLNGFC